MKFVNIVLAILFALFALAQYNDSDAWNWVVVYLFVAVVSVFAARGDYNRGVLVLAILLIVGWMALLLPEFKNWIDMGMPTITGEMKTSERHVELVREFLGLGCAFITLVFHYFQSRKFD